MAGALRGQGQALLRRQRAVRQQVNHASLGPGEPERRERLVGPTVQAPHRPAEQIGDLEPRIGLEEGLREVLDAIGPFAARAAPVVEVEG